MNLFYLLKTKNSRLDRSDGVAHMRMMVDGILWRGAKVTSKRGVLRVDRATECEPFRSRCDNPGWYIRSIEADTTARIRFLDGDRVVGERELHVSPSGFDPVMLPWPLEPQAGDLDLEVACDGAAPMFIGVHYTLDREPLLQRCKGKGVEIGPGPAPRVLNSSVTQVLYVEQKSPDEWERLYGSHYAVKFDPQLKPFYVVGEANSIPADRGSLDFIFSSHVFEHLANPLGHLELWSELLRPGGEVLMVIPDYIGSKDFRATATTLPEAIDEYSRSAFEPTLQHYQRYADARGGKADAHELQRKKASVHVHYYTNGNMAELLRWAVGRGWFSAFSLIHSRNAKDFHVILAK